MLTQGFFATSYQSPVFKGFHDANQSPDAWATPRFEPDQVSQIIDWVMSAPDDGEIIGWNQDTVIHQLGVAEADRTDFILPDADGRYGIGWHSWPWIEMPSPDGSGAEQLATRSQQPLRSAVITTSLTSGSEDQNGPDQPSETEMVKEHVQYVGWRSILVRTCTRGSAGFDVFAGGQRLTHADPFPAEPTYGQLSSFLSMRKRGLDLLIAEHGAQDQDLYALLHGTQACPRYAAITRNDQSTLISLHESLDEAVQCLRDHAVQDTRSRILGVQDLDGPFLPAHVQITLTSREQTQGHTTGRQSARVPSSTPFQHIQPIASTPAATRQHTSQPADAEVHALDGPGSQLPTSPRSASPGRKGRPARVVPRPRNQGTRSRTRRSWAEHHDAPCPGSAPARAHLRSLALDIGSALIGVVAMCMVAVSALALAMTAVGVCDARRLPPRHRASSSRILSALTGHPCRAPRGIARHLSTT